MEIKKALENALHDAMRSKNDTVLKSIRLVMSTVKLAEIEKGKPMDDAGIIAVLQKEIKSRKESIADAEKASRPDLISAANAEIAVLEAYLPKQISEAELNEIVKNAIAEIQASAPSDMGKVMKIVMPKVQGRVAGDVLSQAVRKQLGG
jgi:uncharacterized protein YqeY